MAKYRLTFARTRATKSAPTLQAARADARYWLDFGNTRVCIQRRMPSGTWRTVECKTRRKR